MGKEVERKRAASARSAGARRRLIVSIWQAVDERRRSEIAGIITIAAAVIIILSLFTYNAGDISFNTSTVNNPRHNLIGAPGAYLAWVMYLAVGYAAWLIPALLLIWGASGFRRPPKQGLLLRTVGGMGLLASLCALASILFSVAEGTDTAAITAGGLLGSLIGSMLAIFGTAGSLIILIAAAAISLLLASEFLFSETFLRMRLLLVRIWERWKASRPDRMEPVAIKPEDHYLEDEGPILLRDMRSDVLQDDKPDIEDAIFTNLPDNPVIYMSEFPAPGLTMNESEIPPVVELPTVKMDTPVRIDRKERPPKVVKLEKPQPESHEPEEEKEYQLPPLSLLSVPVKNAGQGISRQEIQENSQILVRTLGHFGINVRVIEVNSGPVITRYELEPPPGVKVNRIVSLADDIALALRAMSVRIVAPIPGKAAVGVEIPNRVRGEVLIREILTSPAYEAMESKLKIALGKTLSGESFVADLARMPHLLIAGATGSGKSVCVNSIIASILFQASPEEVKFCMIDPKRVELQVYSDIPHLLFPVQTNPKRAGRVLKWIVEEMEQRYKNLAQLSVRDIREYNKKITKVLTLKEADPGLTLLPAHLPYIIVLIDELADLMMIARADVETMICRLAQMARAVGIHLVLTTQRPSVNVITGVIKANFPTRIAFQVSSKVDSRTIMDYNGAEALLGRGDMLFCPGGADRPVRLQGSLISMAEIENLVESVKAQRKPAYLDVDFDKDDEENEEDSPEYGADMEEQDDLYREALDLVLATRTASTSLLQRRLKIGYGRAARLLDLMHEEGIVGPPRGSKPREVLTDILGR